MQVKISSDKQDYTLNLKLLIVDFLSMIDIR